jgi:uncharacterized protein DUF2867
MRLPNTAHTARPWRIHELTPDFRLEDVWALPTPGGPDDFPRLVQLAAELDPARSASPAVRSLFALRWRLGALLRWDGQGTGVGSRVPTLRHRLPADLRAAPAGPEFAGLPFTPLYLLEDEFAAEIANRTMHGVLHLGWVPDGSGGYRGRMAVLVKRNGVLGAAYMAAIAPFRHVLVYPPAIRELGQRFGCQNASSAPVAERTTLRQPAGPSRGGNRTRAPRSRARSVAESTRSTST